MAYFAGVISLQQTIERLLNSSHISILPSDREILESTKEMGFSLQRVLRRWDNSRNNIMSERVNSLHEQIRDVAYKLQDALDSHVSNQFLSGSERLADEDFNLLTFSLNSDEVLKQEINNFTDMVKKVEDENDKQDMELSNSLPEEEEDDADSSRIDFGGVESNMVGLSHEFIHVKKALLGYSLSNVFSISGMAGIGKTTLAKKLYQDPEICNYFKCRLWVTIGQKYQFRKMMLGLLAQLDHDVDKIQTEGDEKLGKYLHTSLKGKRFLIVLDDVWNKEVCDELYNYLPNKDKKSPVLLTTRLQQVAKIVPPECHQILRFLDEEESWCLLREKVFGGESCPYRLEEAGKKIALNCDGLPLLIVTVADLLSKAEKTLEYWTKIANGEDKSLFIKANDKISSILLRSYKYLPQEFKACFLYMAVFPSKCMISTSKLFNLWTAEDLCEYSPKEYLDNLISSNVVLVHQDAAIGGSKTCKLHSSFWHVCVKQSWKEKFLNVINSLADSSKEGAISWRRLCIYNNVLFGIKEVYDSLESISGARSLICSGAYHQYPVPICFSLRLLKVLDILSVRFYKFPVEVLKLIHIRYLALTYGGKVPPSISKLWNLEYLIVRQHQSIKFPGHLSYIPVEIWNLQKLRHLQVMGSCLPFLCDASLPNLLKLSDVSVDSCTEEIFKRIPNLQKLGIQIELAPNPDAAEPFSCFDHFSHLEQLQSLKCVIVNPNPARPQLVAPPASVTTFPSGLKKLSLSGFGYPWSYMRVIGKLPCLRVLKLRSYAFRGHKWKVHKSEFPALRYLLLEDLDLVHMTFPYFSGLPKLDTLIIKHCYKLKTIPLKHLSFLKVEVVDSPSIAKYSKRNQDTTFRQFIIVQIHSSWEDGKLKA
ncbi:Apoptotic ATPase [Handroanthus impetiginosus]|uniref:Apoptotic ATPase n=1 Tax=Handroanthus impetiginosus TaxID=429701 RepID=A0A2G9FZM8_9LAMI|nr:Apoptotic ATPase [Handroanthus impetiginosus]